MNNINNSSFFSSSLYSFLGIFISKAFSLFATILLFRVLTTEDIGLYFYFMSLLAFGASIVQLGHNFAILDFFVLDQKKDYINIFIYRILVAPVIFIIIIIFLIAKGLSIGNLISSIFILSSIIATSFSLDCFLKARNYFDRIALIQIGSSIINLLGICAIYFFFEHSLLLISIATFISTFFLNLMPLIYKDSINVIREIFNFFKENFRNTKKILFNVIKFNIGHTSTAFVLSLGLAFDMLLSEQVLSSYNLGILSAFLRIVFVILAFQAAQNFVF